MAAAEFETLSTTVVSRGGGVLHRIKHKSTATKTDMTFAIFLPSTHTKNAAAAAAEAVGGKGNRPPLPAIYWLSGLTCTDANFCQKAGGSAFAKAEEEGIVMVMPDTSPRGGAESMPSDDSYDLGTGAGFYINATNAPWDVNYRMEEYVAVELPALVEAAFGGAGGQGLRSLAGHSMGGHGALTLALKAEPGTWCSVSAFAPICHPTKCPWGEKAFKNYFGSVEAGKDHDATELMAKPGKAGIFDDILIDEGTADEFRASGQLLLEDFEKAASSVGQKLTVRRQEGFDHSYYFIAAFIQDHVAFHAKKLRKAAGSASTSTAVPKAGVIGVKHGYRIAIVCDFFYPRLGGVEMHCWSLSQHLLRQGHKVILITHAYGNRTGVRYMGPPSSLLKVYYCPIIPMTDEDCMPSFTATFPILRHIFLRERIDIVHAHQATSVLANESVAYGSALGLATVYTDHSLFGFNDVASVILNRVLQTTLSTVDAAICVSNTCRDNLILRAHLDPQRVSFIPNAVDPAKFSPDPSKRSTDRIKVVVVSRLMYRKGIDLLVGVIPHICRELEHVDFIIGGDGNKLLNLKEMVERERLQDRVEFLGSVPHVDVRSVLVRGHIFLNCSLTESFCIAILEAACCGLLVVSTCVGGVPEVLPHDMVLLAEPNVPAIVENVKEAVKRQVDSNTAVDSWKNHERLKHMYSWHRVGEQTAKVYDTIMRQERRSLLDRLECYRSLGGFAGLVAMLLGLTMELWLRFVSWWQPAELIDRVPDLMSPQPRDGGA